VKKRATKTKAPRKASKVLSARNVTGRIALQESEAKIHSILDTVVDGVITIDGSGIIQSFNLSAERLFGYKVDEIVGQNVKILMSEPYHSEHDSYLTNYLRTGKAKNIGISREVVARRKDGTTFPIDLAVGEIKTTDAKHMFTGIVRDITERKRAEEERAKYEARLLALHRHASQLSVAKDLDTIVKQTLDAMNDSLRFEYNEFMLVEKNVLEIKGSRGRPGPAHHAEPLNGRGVSVKAANTKSTLRISDTRKEPAYVDHMGYDWTGPPTFLSEMDAPVLLDDEAVAVLAVNSVRVDAFTDNDQNLLEILAIHVGQALGRLKDEEELRRNSANLEGLVVKRTGELRGSEEKYRALFEACPISLWEEDYSAVKQFLDELRQKGVSDFNAYFASHPKDVAKCAGLVKVVNVNQATLDLYGGNSVDEIVGGLRGGLVDVFTEESSHQFVGQIVALAQGKKHYEAEIENKSLRGELKRCNLICSVVSGYEESLAKVLVCMVDLTPQKLLEEENRKLTSGVTMRLLEVTDQVSSLAKVREKLKTAPDVTSGLGMILDAALWDFGLDFGAILTVDREANMLKVRASKGKEREIRLEDSYPIEGFVELKDLPSEGVTRVVGEGDRSIFNAATEYIMPILSGKDMFGVMVFGKVTRDSGEVGDMRLLKLYADLAYSLVLERSLHITPTLETKRVGRGVAGLEPGQMYVVKKHPEKAFEMFASNVFSNHEGLCITRRYPPKVRSMYALEKTPIVWLTGEASETEKTVQSLQDISIIIANFMEKATSPAILIDGFEYLVTNSGFDSFLRFLQVLNDRLQRKGGVLFAPILEEAFGPKELALLHRETTNLPE
jgi:PAS domain S-box-containing protein